MIFGTKAVLREALPKATQVPIKYWLDRARGYLEPEMALLPFFVGPGQRVVDIGGNRGVYAYRLWKLGAVVEVFEPNPVCLTVLKAWAQDRDRVHLHSCGLSDTSGSAELHIPIDHAGVEHDASASLEEHGFARERAQSVELARLDSFHFKDVSFIKIDVEGHELRVIDGACVTLAQSAPVLLVEIEQRHCASPMRDVFNRIISLGYVGYYLDKGRLESIDTFDLRRHQDPSRLGVRTGAYINNFLFLSISRLQSGEYCRLEALGLPK